jgi:hypothetical protein
MALALDERRNERDRSRLQGQTEDRPRHWRVSWPMSIVYCKATNQLSAAPSRIYFILQ